MNEYAMDINYKKLSSWFWVLIVGEMGALAFLGFLIFSPKNLFCAVENKKVLTGTELNRKMPDLTFKSSMAIFATWVFATFMFLALCVLALIEPKSFCALQPLCAEKFVWMQTNN